MPVQPGQSLSHYRIVEKLGEGGMGVVWRVEDTVLKREVALKLLPEGFDRDPDRLARFQREARFLASLNHPNIAAIHGFEEADGERFLVLELAAGVSLAERLKKGPLPVEQALKISVEIARALEAAHEKGVIHRDLKPGNVHLGPKGEIKVLDFGLAKALGAGTTPDEKSQQATVTAATGQHTVMGTTPYMSPEQASAKELDKRTDIWAFGCVLYELLTGEKAFQGETVSSTIAAIHAQAPNLERLPPQTPVAIHTLLLRCLEKDVDRRLRDIGDARIEIEDALAGRESTRSVKRAATTPTRLSRAASLFALVLLIGLTAVILWRWRSRPAPPTTEPIRHTLVAPPGLVPATTGFDVSPDGSAVVYVGNPARPENRGEAVAGLYIQQLGEFAPRLIDGSPNSGWFAFSADGQWLAFRAPVAPGSDRLQLFKVPVDGSAPHVRVADWPERPVSCCFDWLPDGDFVMVARPKEDMEPWMLLRIPGEGRSPPPPIAVELPDSARSLQVFRGRHLPGGRFLLVGANTKAFGGKRYGTGLLDVETGEARMLIEDGALGVWTPSGHIVASRHDKLLAFPYDIDRREVTGPPDVVLDGLRTNTTYQVAPFALSRTGTLVYVPGGISIADRRIVIGPLDTWAKPPDLRQFEVWSGPHTPPILQHAYVSSDLRTLVVCVNNFERASIEIWVSDFERPRLRPLVAEGDGVDCFDPVFHPDGTRLAYSCLRPDGTHAFYLRRLDGMDEPELLLETDGGWPINFTPDGESLVFQGDAEIWKLPLDRRPGEHREPVRLGEGFSDAFAFSTDGRWFAYTTAEGNQSDAMIRRWEDDRLVGPPIRVSAENVVQQVVLWAPNEPVLYYLTESGAVNRVTITEPGPVVSEPEYAFNWSFREFRSAAWLPDGRLMAVQRSPVETEAQRIFAVQHWFEELRQELAAAE